MNRVDLLHLLGRFLPELSEYFTIRDVQSGFSSAQVFQISMNQQSYALRSWPLNGLPTPRLFELHHYLSFLHDHSVPVAVPVPDRQSGITLVNWANRRWQIEPWLPGDARDGQSISDSERTNMMRTLARLHLTSVKFHPTQSGTKWFATRVGRIQTVEERIRLINDWPEARIVRCRQQLAQSPEEFKVIGWSILSEFRRCSNKIQHELMSLVDIETTVFPCWRDLWRDHVLFDQNLVTGLIDPTATRTDHVGTDLSRLLGSFFEDSVSDWEIALSAYEDVRPLSPQDHNIIHALNRSSVLLSGLTWLERWAQNQIPYEQLSAVLKRMSVIERRMRNL